MHFFEFLSTYSFKLIRKSSLVTIITFCLASAAAAQTTSTITGAVQDTDGATLVGVKVTARHINTGLSLEVVTAEDGRYVFPAMPVGNYEIRADMSGFRPLLRQGIKLVVGETAIVDLVLEAGALDETVTVTGEAALVNTQTPELSYLVGERAIRELPLNGRNYTDLALLQPGVLAFPHRDGGSVVAHGLGMSINGQDPRSNVYLLDGTLQNDFTNGPAGSAASTVLGIEAIREFRVEANTYGAEFGRNSGGQINALSKSGTNELHGSLFYFHRNDNFDARNFFDGARKPEFKRNQFGGSLGGPVSRDRSFYFFTYEALRENLGRTVSTVVPDDNARLGILPDPANPGRTITVQINPLVRPFLDEFPRANGPNLGGGLAAFNFGFPQTIDQNYFTGRIDHNVGDDDQFFARYTYDDADQFLPTDFPQFPRTFLSRNQFFTVEYRNNLSARTFQTLRGSFSRTRIGQNVEANISQALTPFVPGRDLIGNINIGGPAAIRHAIVGEPPAGAERLRLRARAGPLARPSLDQGWRASRALPGQHGQPDLQPRHVHVRQPQRLSQKPRAAIRRSSDRRRARSLLALYALRFLRAGYDEGKLAPQRERGAEV